MLLPAIEQLPYQPDALLTLFAPLAYQPWSMLLHSGFAEHQNSRFDILVADPFATVLTNGTSSCITIGAQCHYSTEDPLALLQQLVDQHLPKLEVNDALPFQGGALGAFSYDLSRRFEQLPSIAARDIDLPEMAVGIYDWALIADHQQQTLTLLSHRDIQLRKQWLQQQAAAAIDKTPLRLLAPWRGAVSRKQYEQQFEAIQAYLRSGDCYQVNLTQRFQAPYCGDEWQAFLLLSQANRAPFSAFLRLPAQTILSLSPERFIQLQDGVIQTRPIKGTVPRHADPLEDKQAATHLANSPKDHAENLMIVDLMRNDIGRIAQPGSVQVPELFAVEAFPAVHHLVSTVSARLQTDKSATDVLRACLPGGSITGAPKIRAMEIIEQLEPQRRSLYCGSIGYISCCGSMDSSIVIRTVLAEQGQLYCWAGGGIVADSQVNSEYQECLDKLACILPLLGATDVSLKCVE